VKKIMEALYLGQTQLRADQETMKTQGLREDVLVDRAVRGLENAMVKAGLKRQRFEEIHFLIGPGNNGSDALGLAWRLFERGFSGIHLWQLSDRRSPLSEAYWISLTQKGIVPRELSQFEISVSSALVVDGLFGVSFKGELPAAAQAAFSVAERAKVPVWSLDLPSGMDANSGQVSKGTPTAEKTFSVGLPKWVLRLPALRSYFGEVTEVEIGLNRETVTPDLFLVEEKDLRDCLPEERPSSAHKRSFGELQICAGSLQYPGAARLVALGAFKSGCGFLRLESRTSFEVLRDLPEIIPGFTDSATAYVLGPGWSAAEDEKYFEMLEARVPENAPCLLDGGALSFYSQIKSSAKTILLTPHEGEMARLMGNPWTAEKIRENRLEALRIFHQRHPQIHLLLKGSGTLVASFGKIYMIPWGSVAMATAGQGDLLSGVVGAYLAQGLAPATALILGSAICSLIGDELTLGRERQGVLAHEIAEKIPELVAKIRSGFIMAK
jgi:ADP-dependent NAD(P)H-hydrate dehydratase / NAD(P)H-hydrate epimerase